MLSGSGWDLWRYDVAEREWQRAFGIIALASLLVCGGILAHWAYVVHRADPVGQACLSIWEMIVFFLAAATLVCNVALLLFVKGLRLTKLDARRRSFAQRAILGCLFIFFAAFKGSGDSESGIFLFSREMDFLWIGILLPVTLLHALVAAGVLDIRRVRTPQPDDQQAGD